MARSATAVYGNVSERRWFGRALEIFPGLVTWSFLLAPIVLSFTNPLLVAYFIIAFDLYWLIKAFRLSTYLVRGYGRLHRAEKIDWRERLKWIESSEEYLAKHKKSLSDLLRRNPRAKRYFQVTKSGVNDHNRYLDIRQNIGYLTDIIERKSAVLAPAELYNVVIMATYDESYDVLESSVKSLLKVDYPRNQLILVIAYEERGGEQTKQNAKKLIAKYGPKFFYAEAVMHPDGIAGEIRGKGGNITYAGRKIATYIDRKGIDPEHVIVTTFDADHRASDKYFSYLSYVYAINPNRIHKSYQPIPMFYNNIWDAPAPMRVIATNNSFWVLMETMRPHRLRNFAAHAQSLRALLDTDFWSVTTIVEDGHQYWRSYFTYDGDHEVVPIYVPVYQDAVLAETYIKTFRVQYKQLQRWAWGISDFSFVVRNSIRNNRIAFSEKVVQIFRLFEGHFSWATAALIISFVAWLPLFLNPHFSQQELAHQLPIIASRLMNVALIGLIITVAISMISLPPRPKRYGRRRSLAMVLQWALLPVTAIAFGSFAAIDAQTRLMFGRYLEFKTTTKSRRK